MYTQEEISLIAGTILHQLGGQARLALMAGCKNFGSATTDGRVSVSFRIGKNPKGRSYCRITLDDSDTYTVEMGRYWKHEIKDMEQRVGIYADQLMDTFEDMTGLYLTFSPRS